jgi:hypothetical protein
MQFVTLLFPHFVSLDYAVIRARTAELLGEAVDSSPPHEASKAFLLFYPAHPVSFKEGAMPPQTAFLVAGEVVPETYIDHVQQSWAFSSAAETVNAAKHAISLAEMMAQPHPPELRLRLFHAALQATVETCNPSALVFNHSCQVIDPASYLSKCGEPVQVRPGTINVRFFTISNSADDMVMDVRGLEEIGLPDLQCHFRGLDPREVAGVLFNTAAYIVENGPVISSGQTIEGASPGDKWRCQFEESLLAPKREVLDVNPGPPFAAGNR